MKTEPGASGPEIPLEKLLSGLGSTVRWAVLRELAKGEPLPVVELASRLRLSQSAMSKQMGVLRWAGLVVRRYGSYALPRGVRSEDGATLDFGHVVLRVRR